MEYGQALFEQLLSAPRQENEGLLSIRAGKIFAVKQRIVSLLCSTTGLASEEPLIWTTVSLLGGPRLLSYDR